MGYKILLVDDHIIIRKGLVSILRQLPDIEYISEVDNGRMALEEVASRRFDLVLLDVSMPEMDGLEALKLLKRDHPELKVLMVTMHPEEYYAVRALQGGASGYLRKDCSPDVLIKAVREVLEKGKYISPSLGIVLAEKISGAGLQSASATDSLSDRELQVLRLIGTGVPIKEIAEQLYISPKTVATYKSRICQKLHLKNNVELLRYLIDKNL